MLMSILFCCNVTKSYSNVGLTDKRELYVSDFINIVLIGHINASFVGSWFCGHICHKTSYFKKTNYAFQQHDKIECIHHFFKSTKTCYFLADFS